MTIQIKSLTPEQTAAMSGWADKWIEIGLRTGKADRALAEDALKRCYKAANLKWHGRTVWVDNPLTMAIAAPIAAELIEQKKSNAKEIPDLVEKIKKRWGSYLGGQFWVGGWYWGNAYVSFFRDVCGLKLPPKILAAAKACEDLNSSCCWVWPHSHFAMLCERPSSIHRESTTPGVRGWNSHRLHNIHGPAIAWNGFAVYAIHGVRVPEAVVMRPETITAKQVADEPNAEVRRVMVERMGAAKYLQQADAKLIDEGKRGKLWRCERKDDTALEMVEVLNSTPEPDGTIKTYFLRVKPGFKTAQAAIAWTFGMESKQYKPQTET